MTFWKLIARSLRFHARDHIGVVLGSAIGSAALIGALVVGDSVRATLRQRALEVLADASVAMAPGDRFFNRQLLSTTDRATVATLLVLPGTATQTISGRRANHVQIYGVEGDYWNFSGKKNLPAFDSQGVVINQALANGLEAHVGDELLLRVEKASRMSRDAAVMEREDQSIALRLTIDQVLPVGIGGELNLNPGAAPAMNAFINLGLLSQRIDLTNKVNLCLARPVSNALQDTELISNLTTALHHNWSLDDASLKLVDLENPPGLELRTTRVFLEAPIADAAEKIQPTNSTLLLTYLANLVADGKYATPYSMVAAARPPYVPADMKDDEILLTDWLAQDLSAKPGDVIELSYFLPDSGVKLAEATNKFKVHGIVPVEGVYADRGLMPDFPGLDKAESTSDWNAAFPLVYKIRPKDEVYWKERRGTPKAYVTLAAGQKMWANRFGALTAIRFPRPAGVSKEDHRKQVQSALLSSIQPEQIGFQFQPVRARALKAAEQAQDFGELFLGFSFFIILAALTLMAMLFQFGLEKRLVEAGTLLAIGFRPRQVARLFLTEGAVLATLGGILGALGGLLYAKAMLWGLRTIWSEAVAGTSIVFHVSPASVFTGIGLGIFLSLIAVWLTLRKQVARPARELLAGEIEIQKKAKPKQSPDQRGGSVTALKGSGIWVGAIGMGGALASVGWALFGGNRTDPETFFCAGSLLLAGGLGLAAAWFRGTRERTRFMGLSISGLGIRGCVRRSKRSLATAGLLASGCFLIVAIAAFQLDANQDATSRTSGTGGFALVGESSFPVVQDVNSRRGRESFGFSSEAMRDVSFISMRVHAGEEASCLNLSRAQRPRLLGVHAESLNGRFTFTGAAKGLELRDGWKLLRGNSTSPSSASDSKVVPAIADANSIQWALGKKLGDTIDYTDEQGREFKVRLVGAVANSILQGNLIIDEAEFIRLFPGESGYRLFLIDAPSNSVAAVSQELSRAMQDAGLELTPAAKRLNAFNAVQNTYLGTFRVLGGLGLLLGSAGLGIVVLRNVLERRGELGLLVAVGFRRRVLQRMVLQEHAALLGLGLAIGLAAAGVAVLPAMLTPGTHLPYLSLGLTLAAVLINGAIWTWIATRIALRGDLLAALRNE